MAGILHAIIAPIGAGSGLVFAIDTPNINVHNLLIAQGWDGVSVVHPTLTILATAKIYSTSTAVPAFDTGSLPVGSTVTVLNNGYILGRGGNGGNGASPPAGTSGNPGGAGGPAFKAQVPLTLTNNGIIGGGGGGGGGAYNVITGAPGGGGGIGGSSGGAGIPGSLNGTTAIAGEAGTLLAAGRGGVIINQNGTYGSGGGGFYGTAGAAGYNLGGYIAGAGGAAGVATIGNANITWITSGTIYGALT